MPCCPSRRCRRSIPAAAWRVIRLIPGVTTTIPGTNIVGANGQPVTVLDATGTPVEIFQPVSTTATAGVNHAGLGDSQSQIFHNTFPSYTVGVNLQLPLRNRQAQATNQRAMLQLRQIEAQMQQLKNAALLDVRNTYIALEQDRARVQAASKARELQQQTFDAEQKRYQLGASTVYNVILTQRDLITAQGTNFGHLPIWSKPRPTMSGRWAARWRSIASPSPMPSMVKWSATR